MGGRKGDYRIFLRAVVRPVHIPHAIRSGALDNEFREHLENLVLRNSYEYDI